MSAASGCVSPPVGDCTRLVVDGTRVSVLGLPAPLKPLSTAAATANTVTTSSSSASVVVDIVVAAVVGSSVSVSSTVVVVTTDGGDDDGNVTPFVLMVCDVSSDPTVVVLL